MSYLYHSLLNQSSFFELLVFFFRYIYRQAWMIFVHLKLFFCSLGWCGAFIPFTQVTPCISTLNLSIIFLECFPVPSRLQLILFYTVLEKNRQIQWCDDRKFYFLSKMVETFTSSQESNISDNPVVAVLYYLLPLYLFEAMSFEEA